MGLVAGVIQIFIILISGIAGDRAMLGTTPSSGHLGGLLMVTAGIRSIVVGTHLGVTILETSGVTMAIGTVIHGIMDQPITSKS